MASRRGRGRRHAHKQKRPDSAGFSAYMAAKVCSVCGKQCYSSRDEARRSARINHPSQVMHAYYCDEPTGQRWWHLSSIPADKLEKLRENKHAEEDLRLVR